MDAICSSLAAGNLTWPYCKVSMRNFIFEHHRNLRTRNEDYYTPTMGDDDGEPVELEVVVQPSQHIHITARECATAIESLPDSCREVMRFVAMEYSADEIAKLLNIPLSDAVWKIKYGRKIMRERDGYEIERKRGHHQYIGIRKKHRIWEATVRKGETSHYLGHFKTAADAAKAYDAKAKELFGAEAKLNFGEPSTAHG